MKQLASEFPSLFQVDNFKKREMGEKQKQTDR